MAVRTYQAKGLVQVRIKTFQKDVAERRLEGLKNHAAQMGVELEWLTLPELEEAEEST